MTFSSNRLIAIGDTNNLSPFNTDVPDPSIEVKVSLSVPSGGGITLVPGTTTNQNQFQPIDLKKFSRINVEIKIENITKQNLDAVMDAIKAEVIGKATNLLNMPEAI